MLCLLCVAKIRCNDMYDIIYDLIVSHTVVSIPRVIYCKQVPEFFYHPILTNLKSPTSLLQWSSMMLKVDPRFFVCSAFPSTPHLQMHKLCRCTKHHQTTSPKQHAIRELRANWTPTFVYSTIPSPKRYVCLSHLGGICASYTASFGSYQCRATRLQRIETIPTSLLFIPFRSSRVLAE